MVFTDNWGKLMANIFQVPTQNGIIFTMQDITGVFKNYLVYKDRDIRDYWNGSAGVSYAQVGKGTTPATPQDFQIEIPFTNGGVEDVAKITSIFGYNSALGKITITTSISPTGSSGTINEVVKINSVEPVGTNSATRNLWLRNLVPSTDFISGKTINIEHEFLI